MYRRGKDIRVVKRNFKKVLIFSRKVQQHFGTSLILLVERDEDMEKSTKEFKKFVIGRPEFVIMDVQTNQGRDN